MWVDGAVQAGLDVCVTFLTEDHDMHHCECLSKIPEDNATSMFGNECVPQGADYTVLFYWEQCQYTLPAQGNYYDDFMVGGWSTDYAEPCGEFDPILGGYGFEETEVSKEYVIAVDSDDDDTLCFVSIDFMFYQIESWDNEDAWVRVNGEEMWRENFHLSNSGSSQCGQEDWGDSVHPIHIETMVGTTFSLTIGADIDFNGQGGTDESFGISPVAFGVYCEPVECVLCPADHEMTFECDEQCKDCEVIPPSCQSCGEAICHEYYDDDVELCSEEDHEWWVSMSAEYGIDICVDFLTQDDDEIHYCECLGAMDEDQAHIIFENDCTPSGADDTVMTYWELCHTPAPSYTAYEHHGWCKGMDIKIADDLTHDECWNACWLAFGDDLVAIDGIGEFGSSGSCYCQDACEFVECDGQSVYIRSDVTPGHSCNDDEDDDDDFTTNNYIITSEFGTGMTGAEICYSKGLTVGIITNDAENELVRLACEEFSTSYGSCLLLLNDADVEGSWTWVDGTSMEYSHFSEGEPNNHGSGEDCVQMLADGNWNDVSCDYSAPVVCMETTIPPVDGEYCTDEDHDHWVELSEEYGLHICYEALTDLSVEIDICDCMNFMSYDQAMEFFEHDCTPEGADTTVMGYWNQCHENQPGDMLPAFGEYLDDFTTEGWSTDYKSVCGELGMMLGGVDFDEKMITKQYEIASDQICRVTVDFEYIQLESWDHERAWVSIDDNVMWEGNFQHSDGSNKCGMDFGDNAHHVHLETFVHGGFVLTAGTDTDQEGTDESFGISKVLINTDCSGLVDTNYCSEDRMDEIQSHLDCDIMENNNCACLSTIDYDTAFDLFLTPDECTLVGSEISLMTMWASCQAEEPETQYACETGRMFNEFTRYQEIWLARDEVDDECRRLCDEEEGCVGFSIFDVPGSDNESNCCLSTYVQNVVNGEIETCKKDADEWWRLCEKVEN